MSTTGLDGRTSAPYGRTGAPRAFPAPVGRVAATVWTLYDVALAVLAIGLSTDGFNRTGIVSLLWMALYAAVVLRIALSWRAVFDLLGRNWPFLLFPAVCLSTTLWSVMPSETLRAAFQMTMTTVIAVVIGWRFPLVGIAIIQWGVIALTVALSLLNWLTGAFGTVFSPIGGLIGIYTQKNALGQRGMMGVLAATTLLLVPASRLPPLIRPYRRPLAFLAFVSIPPTVLAIVLSKSATSILMLPAGLAMLLALSFHRLPRGLVVLAAFASVPFVALLPLGLEIAGLDPVGATLGALGKDATLTGRTDLWSLGIAALEGRSALGVG